MFKKGIIVQFFYVGMQVAVWSFMIRLALDISDINEREASSYMVYSFICYFIGKFVKFSMIKSSSSKILICFSVIGMVFISYIVLIQSFSVVYFAVGLSICLECWPTIYARTLDTVDSSYRETAGAIIVMAIVGCHPTTIQGFVADKFKFKLHLWLILFALLILCTIFL